MVPGARGQPRILPLAFLAALAAGAAFACALPAPLACAFGALALALLGCFAPPRVACVAAWLACALAFAGAGGAARLRADARLAPAYAHARGWIVGRVDGLPESGPKFVLRVERSSLELPRGARLACVARGLHAPRDGDLVRALADVEGPAPRTNPGGFDARAWSRVAGLSARARLVTLHVVGPPRGLRETLVSPLRAHLLAAVARQERGRASAFLAGFLLGDRSRLDPSASDDLRRAGALHLLAISGMHVALAIALIGRAVALLGLRGRRAACARLFAAVAYSALAGGSASVWRAGATACAVEGGALLRRRPHAEQALGLALFGLVACAPAFALDAGFQLSVLATWGLLALAQPLQRRVIERVREAPRLGRVLVEKASGALLPTLCAQLTALPAMAASFGAVSSLGLLANLALVPVTDLALASGLFALATQLQPFWITADAASLLTLRGAALLARTPAALKPLGCEPWALVALGVGLCGLFVRRRALYLAAVVGAVAILWAPPARQEGAFTWTLFDVGQGDGMLLRFPDGRALLVDGGMADATFDQGARVVVPALRTRGIRKLDAVLATHRDLDHLGGLPSVVRDIPCRWVAGPGDVPSRILGPALRRGGAAGPARPFEVMRGQRLLAGEGYRVTCLWPPRGFRRDPRWTPNRESAVLLVEIDTVKALLMGDADTLVERELVAQGLPHCALLKIGHHGSRTSSGDLLLDAVRPRVALVSVGRVNRFGHPHPDVRARYKRRGIAWRSTGEEGALDVVIDHGRITIDPARGARPIALARRRGAG